MPFPRPFSKIFALLPKDLLTIKQLNGIHKQPSLTFVQTSSPYAPIIPSSFHNCIIYDMTKIIYYQSISLKTGQYQAITNTDLLMKRTTMEDNGENAVVILPKTQTLRSITSSSFVLLKFIYKL